MMRSTTILITALFLLCNCSTSNPVNGVSAKALATDAKVIEENLDRLMQGYDLYGRFSGTILIASDDKILYQNSFGYADKETGRKNSASSIYGIGSVTKQFTATAVLKLAQEGKLKLSDKLSNFFPALGETASEISIHHLLSMSSGIYEDFSRSKTYDIESVIFPEAHPISTSALVHYFDELTSDSKPGNKFDYSNINYILLAAIIEKVSGQEYGEFLAENFWMKLGMNSTVFGSENAHENLLSKPYLGLPNQHETPDYWHDSWTLGAGGAFSSAEEIYKWMYNVNNYNVLDSLHTQKLFQRHTKDGREHYAYGWQIGNRKGNEYRYHGGGTLGYVCEVGFFPEHNIYMVVLTNHTHNLMDIGKSVRLNNGIVKEIQNILFAEPFSSLPIPKENGSISFSGNFDIGGYNFDITQSDNNLNILSNENGPSILDLPFWQDLTEDTKRFKKAQKIAVAFGEEDFRYVRRKSVLLMKTLISTKKLGEIWEEINGNTGEFKGYNFYRIPGGDITSTYWVRLIHENKHIGVRLNLTKRGKLRGMHIDQSFSFGGPIEVEAKIIDGTSIFIDGFKHNYPDAYIERTNDHWVVKTVVGEFIMK